ncbi:MAG: outer membrane lipid asymmetry maintenance protein MlaD [Thiobacillus sp.]|jgi:phospholipid/cholesterol/gamma-HCH transport system substrate-binding protein|uniref:outer membrane lipid asymmetry maintenance protein MlaD n=1 Tax=unclassified Thiobacillus TaxID=2646513 RepID=UPI00086D2B8D|nr:MULTISPECIES: outer membrane lipid asymmetry maintenance protein MlaD [unclassified Thiobacillus]MBS0310040.1 outer membrane lipid asymmetry maintenance protein MlaD [Pseudomonadota bacterium]MBN8770435.1 outer membrane lipid asymmetry maintenance protein MlaD [Thiobacillus sp.]MBN8778102.1 outer membrane lipid asymmetry maintenance protein MlaD [Thiobacillus sp.]MBS0329325.1 outer membrane lipid asymmetry maintenance protein MlaD [Pseudomonadota bacterium]ODV01549.1 MAG: outer membrane lip
MNRTVLDFWVGLFVIAGIGALLFLALKVGSMSTVNSADSYEVIADFQNIGGLKPRAPVKSAGVVVGRVADIRFDNEKYEAAVTLRLDKRYAFPKDTSAAIMTSGLLGEQYVGLEAGGDSQKLKDKDRILITQDAVVLENLIGQFLYGKAQEGAPK